MHEFVPSFRIVGVHLKEDDLKDNTMLIETYSSKTGIWAISSLIGTGFVDVDEFGEPYVSNCVFHWPIVNQAVAVYDPNEDDNHLQLINLPKDYVFDFTLSRSANDDVLWVGIEVWFESMLKFWKLPKDEHDSYKRTTTINGNEWILMYTIDTRCLCNDVTLLLGNKKRKKHDGGTVDHKVLCLRVEAFTPWNPTSVILSHKLRVFRYYLESKKIELIQYHGFPLADKSSTHTHHMHPYVEPLHLSSYALSGDTYG